ncbi:MAG: hypothetical protein U5R49_13570 [Deltaproteobacteria bacterium]|nr:hypothetical protein [Deltaproteobacteria bacterium]
MKYTHLLVAIALFVTPFFLPSVLFAASRGIRVISRTGEELLNKNDDIEIIRDMEL